MSSAAPKVPEKGMIISTRNNYEGKRFEALLGVVTQIHPNEQFTVRWNHFISGGWTRRYPFRSFPSFSVRGQVEE